MFKNIRVLDVMLGALIGVLLGSPALYWVVNAPVSVDSAGTVAVPVVYNPQPPVTVSVTVSVGTDVAISTDSAQPVKLVVKHASRAEDVFNKVSIGYGVDNQELLALSTTLYCEAVGEPWLGLASVADTIRNRVNSDMFPNTYYGVTTQHKQFSCVRDTSNLTNNVKIRDLSEEIKFRKIINLAARTITGDLPKITSDALFYHTVSVKPYWCGRYHKLGVIGHHVFYTATKL